jgi:hypothetical protein
MNKLPLYFYVIGTIVVWALLLAGVWLWGPSHFHDALTVCGGFYIGELSMFIAVHFYRWK